MRTEIIRFKEAIGDCAILSMNLEKVEARGREKWTIVSENTLCHCERGIVHLIDAQTNVVVAKIQVGSTDFVQQSEDGYHGTVL